jgi:hypothetical protein
MKVLCFGSFAGMGVYSRLIILIKQNIEGIYNTEYFWFNNKLTVSAARLKNYIKTMHYNCLLLKAMQ